MSIGKWVGLAVSVLASAVLSIATAGAYAAIAAATIGAAVKGYAAAFAVGAAAGAISGFASSTVEQAIDTGDIDWQRVGASVLIGGAIGGVAGAAQYGAFIAKQSAAQAQHLLPFETNYAQDLRNLSKFQNSMSRYEVGTPLWDDAMGRAADLTDKIALNKGRFLAANPFIPPSPLYGAGVVVGSLGGAAAWGTNLLVPTPTAGGVPTPVPPAIAPEDGTVDVGSEGAVLLDEAFG
jgi:hypothetical protein